MDSLVFATVRLSGAVRWARLLRSVPVAPSVRVGGLRTSHESLSASQVRYSRTPALSPARAYGITGCDTLVSVALAGPGTR